MIRKVSVLKNRFLSINQSFVDILVTTQTLVFY